MAVDSLPIDTAGIEPPESGITFEVVEGDSYAADGERTATVSRLEAWRDRLDDGADMDLAGWVVGEWPTAADLLDRTSPDDTTMVYVSIPGWFANLDDNEDCARTLRQAADWDGYDGARPSFWALRDTGHDEDAGAYCLTKVWDDNREQWRDPPSEYGMTWVARSCVRVAEPQGEPTDLDHEPWQVTDGYPDDADPSDRVDLSPVVDRIRDRAQQRAVAKAQNVPDQQFADKLEEFKDGRTEAEEDALSTALGRALTEYRRITGDDAGPGVLAAAVEALEAYDNHEPDD